MIKELLVDTDRGRIHVEKGPDVGKQAFLEIRETPRGPGLFVDKVLDRLAIVPAIDSSRLAVEVPEVAEHHFQLLLAVGIDMILISVREDISEPVEEQLVDGHMAFKRVVLEAALIEVLHVVGDACIVGSRDSQGRRPHFTDEVLVVLQAKSCTVKGLLGERHEVENEPGQRGDVLGFFASAEWRGQVSGEARCNAAQADEHCQHLLLCAEREGRSCTFLLRS